MASSTSRILSQNAPSQIDAPMPGMVAHVAKGEPLVALEAMKMETIVAAPREGIVKDILVHAGVTVGARDLLMILEPA